MTNHKTTKRALLLSVLALALCVSMLAGTTYAWFTDSVTSTNNKIVAGNLAIDLELLGDNGWTSIKESKAPIFNYDNWEPGYVDVKVLKVENEGSLALKWVAKFVAAEELGILADVIDVYVTEDIDAYPTDRAEINSWTKVGTVREFANTIETLWGGDLLAGATKNLGIALKMQETAGNEYQQKEVGAFDIQIFATQYTYEDDSFDNQYDDEAIVCDVLATPETIDAILATATEGMVIGLAKGYYDEITLTQNNLTLVSATGVVGFLNLNAMDGATIDGVTFDQAGAKQTYTFKTGNVQAATDYVANITGDIDSPKAADGLTIKNCTFTNTSGVATVATGSFAPIYFNEQGAATEKATNITVKNCVFACNATQYIALNYLAEGKVVVTGNTFGGNGFATSHNSIQATGNAADWTVTGNTFCNWNTEKTAIGSSKQGSNNVAWTITGNDFCNVEGAVVLALKTSYTEANSVVTVADNTVYGEYGTIVTTPVNGENETVYAGHKIQLNEGVTVATNTAELNAANKENATIVVASGTYNEIPNLKKGVTLIGSGDVVINDTLSNTLNDVTVKNVTFSSGNAQRWSYAKGTVVFENCTFDAKSVYAIHYDGITAGADVTYKNCTIIGWAAITGGAKSLTFDGCKIYGNGTYGVIRVYGDATIKNCTFDVADVNTADVYQDGIHAVDCTVTVENCTNVNGAIEDIFNVSGTGVIDVK